jgi:predicted transcriptional regulator
MGNKPMSVETAKIAAELIAAYVGNNQVSIQEFQALLKSTIATLDGTATIETVAPIEAAAFSNARKLLRRKSKRASRPTPLSVSRIQNHSNL